MRKLMSALAFVALIAFSPVLLHAEDAKPYSDNKEINLLLLLPQLQIQHVLLHHLLLQIRHALLHHLLLQLLPLHPWPIILVMMD